MKGILKFDLPEENKEHKRAVLSTELAIVLFDFIYNRPKNKGENMSEMEYEGYMKAKADMAELLEDWGIDIDLILD